MPSLRRGAFSRTASKPPECRLKILWYRYLRNLRTFLHQYWKGDSERQIFCLFIPLLLTYYLLFFDFYHKKKKSNLHPNLLSPLTHYLFPSPFTHLEFPDPPGGALRGRQVVLGVVVVVVRAVEGVLDVPPSSSAALPSASAAPAARRVGRPGGGGVVGVGGGVAVGVGALVVAHVGLGRRRRGPAAEGEGGVAADGRRHRPEALDGVHVVGL